MSVALLLLLAPAPEVPEATTTASNPKSKVAGKGTMGLGGAFAKCIKARLTIDTGGALLEALS